MESILSFNMIMSCGNLVIKVKKINYRDSKGIVSIATKVPGKPQKQLSTLYEELIYMNYVYEVL